MTHLVCDPEVFSLFKICLPSLWDVMHAVQLGSCVVVGDFYSPVKIDSTVNKYILQDFLHAGWHEVDCVESP